MGCILKKRRNVLSICILTYIIINAFLLIRCYGVYFIDEFYSLGSADLEFQSVYRRSVYINYLVHLFSKLFGKSYYVFKMIPEIVGFISFGCSLYLLNKLCTKNSSILIGSMAFSFNALVLFNHIYIRHYVFQEMVYMVGMVLIYKYTTEYRKLRYTYLFIYLLIAILYSKYTEDASGIALVAIAVVMCIMAIISKKLSKILNNKFFWIISICVWGLLEVFVILLKKQMIDYTSSEILNEIHRVLSFYQTDMFVFFLFLIFVDLAVVIAILHIFYYLIKRKYEDKETLFLLVYTVLPILAYFSFFFNNNMIRSFNPYISAGIILLMIFYDNTIGKKKVLITLLIIINTMFTYYSLPQGLVQFWSEPGIGEEMYSRNYKDWLAEARKAEQMGYTIVPMLTLIQEEHYFDIKSDISLTILDETNNVIREDEELINILDQLMESEKKYALIVDPLGRDALIRIGKFEYLEENYRHTFYDDRMYQAGLSVFYIE